MDTVIVAFENAKFVRQLRELLESAGVAECLPCSSGDQVRRLLQRQGACCVICGPHLTDGPSEWLFDDLPPSCLMLMVGPKHQLDLCGSPDIFKLPTPLRRRRPSSPCGFSSSSATGWSALPAAAAALPSSGTSTGPSGP